MNKFKDLSNENLYDELKSDILHYLGVFRQEKDNSLFRFPTQSFIISNKMEKWLRDIKILFTLIKKQSVNSINLDEYPYVNSIAEISKILIDNIEKSKKIVKNIDPSLFKPDKKKYQEIYIKLEKVNIGFKHIFLIENILRKYIISIFKNSNINFNQNIPSDLKKKILDRKTKENHKKYLALRGKHEIYYLDFNELKKIISKNWGLFESDFESIEWINGKIQELYNYRNMIAHNSLNISEDELKIIDAYSLMIFKQIDSKLVS